MIHNLSQKPSLFRTFIAELRDEVIQKDPMRFRRNLERIGEVMAYELSQKLQYEKKDIKTPLGTAEEELLSDRPVLGTILRAGLPLHQGFLNYFDRAENAFISAYRKHNKDGSFDVELEYMASPSIDGKTLILCDPMLATGRSMVLVLKALKDFGKPAKIHIATAIASKEGINYLQKHISSTTEIWVGAIDDELTAQAYIVPGLGDAGDLAFGEKGQD